MTLMETPPCNKIWIQKTNFEFSGILQKKSPFGNTSFAQTLRPFFFLGGNNAEVVVFI